MNVYADIFKALSDETRLTIVALLLRHGELCVCDVLEVLEITQSKASRHLRYLKNAGLLSDRRDGIWVYYNITTNDQTEAAKVIAAVGSLVSTQVTDELNRRFTKWTMRKRDNKQSCATAGNICNEE